MPKLNIRGAAPLLMALLTVLSGCAAAAAGAGAAAGIAYTNRGVETYVDNRVPEVAVATESAFRSLGVYLPERRIEAGAREVEFEAEYDDHDVKVNIEREVDEGVTHIHVTAREHVVDYDRDIAAVVLREILERLD